MQLEPVVDMPHLAFMVGAKLVLSQDGSRHLDTIVPEGDAPEGQCRLRIYDEERDEELTSPRSFVLATQPAKAEHRRGASMENAIEFIAGMATLLYTLSPFDVFLIEHYEDEADPEKDVFFIDFLPWMGDGYGAPERQQATLDEVEELMKGELF